MLDFEDDDPDEISDERVQELAVEVREVVDHAAKFAARYVKACVESAQQKHK
jgi:hypothetical protein